MLFPGSQAVKHATRQGGPELSRGSTGSPSSSCCAQRVATARAAALVEAEGVPAASRMPSDAFRKSCLCSSLSRAAFKYAWSFLRSRSLSAPPLAGRSSRLRARLVRARTPASSCATSLTPRASVAGGCRVSGFHPRPCNQGERGGGALRARRWPAAGRPARRRAARPARAAGRAGAGRAAAAGCTPTAPRRPRARTGAGRRSQPGEGRLAPQRHGQPADLADQADPQLEQPHQRHRAHRLHRRPRAPRGPGTRPPGPGWRPSAPGASPAAASSPGVTRSAASTRLHSATSAACRLASSSGR